MLTHQCTHQERTVPPEPRKEFGNSHRSHLSPEKHRETVRWLEDCTRASVAGEVADVKAEPVNVHGNAVDHTESGFAVIERAYQEQLKQSWERERIAFQNGETRGKADTNEFVKSIADLIQSSAAEW